MNDIKVNMIKFLMTMFESSCDSRKSVMNFKSNVDELIRRNQIPHEVKTIVYNIYGIQNTDVYKPNIQDNKLMQINMLMMQLDNIMANGNTSQLVKMKERIENGVKMGSILKSAKDIIFAIYDLESIDNPFVKAQKSSKPTTLNSHLNLGPINTTRPPISQSPTPKSAGSSIKKSKQVLNDIDKFLPSVVDEIYYKYPNPHYDGCSGSRPYLHTQLISAIDKPNGAVLCLYAVISDDGCHTTRGYKEIPDSYYKNASIAKKSISSSVGCTSNMGYGGRSC